MSKNIRKVLSLALALAMVVGLLPGLALPTRAEEGGNTYILDVTADLEEMAGGTKADGDTLKVGTGNYFTVIFAAKTKIDGSSKSFEDGYTASKRLNFQAATNVEGGMVPAVSFTAAAAATVKLWWVSGGDGREMAILDENGVVVDATDKAESVKNALYISELKVDVAGTYYIAVPTGSNYLFKAEVAEAAAEPVTVTNILDATADLEAMAAGDKADGDTDVINRYFTIIYKAKTKIDGSNKEFEDGYTAAQRLNFGGATEPENGMIGSVQFTAASAATIKLWWVSGGDGREMAILDENGAVVDTTDKAESVKNALYISTLNVDAAGTYYIAVPSGSNYLFKAEVTETAGQAPTRAPWSKVAAPVVTSVEQKDGVLEVSVQMLVGFDGADSVTVTMLDADGNALKTAKKTDEGETLVVTFTPAASGTYRFQAVAQREDEADKASAEQAQGQFVLPLAMPVIALVHQEAGGNLTAIWSNTPEAESYEVYCDGSLVGTTADRQYTITGLTAGQEYSITVAAVRGEDKTEQSAPAVVTASETAQTAWGFVRFGDSTDDSHNSYRENENGTVTVWSEGGKGKIQPNSTDGLAFYYTAVPTDQNFTLRVNVHLDSWTLSNGQEGFGLLATDRLPAHGTTSGVWNNQLMACATKIEYRWDPDAEVILPLTSTEGIKYTMKLGLGSIFKQGLTPESMAYFNLMPEGFVSETETLELAAAIQQLEKGTYNIAGNAASAVEGTIAEQIDFILEIQKNNTGYFVTYYDAEGNVIKTIKNYDPQALSHLDSAYVYVGFFASRNARATFDVQQFTTIDPADDAPAEEKPVTKITPEVNITSSTVSQTKDYQLRFMANVAGSAVIRVNGVNYGSKVEMKANEECSVAVPLTADEITGLAVFFTPDPNQQLGKDEVLGSTGSVSKEISVEYTERFADQKNLYVSANGYSTGKGTKEKPLDIYTAVNVVRPGQTIVLMEGTYQLETALRIQRDMDGTPEMPIRMVADPAATTRPVLDFMGVAAGFTTGGDYWYFYGFDVTNSQDAQKGFQISGNYNVVDNVNAYNNGNTGIQISRYSSLDLTIASWPSHNLILNCTSYNNADAGYEDADGFAAKLTCGEGNVFDGCVAYNNADDGWDLYAKPETGPIGAVVIRNCVAYGNGYLADGTNAGNGNGFKMGGSSITGKHQLINSVAFNNKAKGIDSNSCPDIIVENCTAYNNGSYNVAFYTNVEQDTAFKATGLISFKDSAAESMTGENLKPKGNQNEKDFRNDTTYYWNGTASQSASGAAFTADMFVSTAFKGIDRNADNTINMNGFLELAASAPANAGARMSGQASAVIELSKEEGCLGGEHTVEVIPGKAATATEDGLTDGEKCAVCGEILKAQEVIPATGEPTQPSQPTQPTQPAQPQDNAGSSTALIVVIVVVVLAGVAAGAVVLLKKKK